MELGPKQKAWIAALRSGEYAQGIGTLRAIRDGVDRFCCLGVMCDVAQKAGWTENLWCLVWPHSGKYRFGEHSNSFRHNRSPLREPAVNTPNESMRNLFALSDGFRKLMAMNDEGAPFSEIADALEREPARFFDESV